MEAALEKERNSIREIPIVIIAFTVQAKVKLNPEVMKAGKIVGLLREDISFLLELGTLKLAAFPVFIQIFCASHEIERVL